MPTLLKFTFEGHSIDSKHTPDDIRRNDISIEHIVIDAAGHPKLKELGIPRGTYHLEDAYGKVEEPEDLKRTVEMAQGEVAEIRIVEKPEFVKIRRLQNKADSLEARIVVLESRIVQAEKSIENKLDAAKKELAGPISRLEARLKDEILPGMDRMANDVYEAKLLLERTQLKIAQINVEELREIAEAGKSLGENVNNCLSRTQRLSNEFDSTKAFLGNDCKRSREAVAELQLYVQGKFQVLIDTDGNLRRDIQYSSETLSFQVDDHKLLKAQLARLENRVAGALEESEALRDLMGSMREDTQFVKYQSSQVATRVHCIEGEARDAWHGFAPGVLYFRHWHTFAKGPDVQLSPDLLVAIGRGRMAAAGIVMGNDEGLAAADGPCRRFGTSGSWSSYFEIEIDAVNDAPKGSGGIYVGFSLQSGDEIIKHKKNEFDGWLMGGPGKALFCRMGAAGMAVVEGNYIPATHAVGLEIGDEKTVAGAVAMLKAAMPPPKQGKPLVKDCEAGFSSQDLKLGDRVGVMFRCKRDGSAVMKIALNGTPLAEHIFVDAPPAEAVGFLTPVVRLAGRVKSARLMPGLPPPPRLLLDT